MHPAGTETNQKSDIRLHTALLTGFKARARTHSVPAMPMVPERSSLASKGANIVTVRIIQHDFAHVGR